MASYTQSIQNLMNELSRLPGIGMRSAERIAFHLLKQNPATRDQGLVCIVEQPKDLLALEAAGLYRGVYHVLLGRIAPLEGMDPPDLTIEPLMARLGSGLIREVIMGTNPNMEGDGTALFIQSEIQAKYPNVAVTRLARGLPTGSSIEYANRNMLAEAISGRQKM
jgi:recombination protein RecR